MDALLLEHVTKTFGSVRAVDGLCARIPAGSIYGFLGPNGAGKTTALRMVMNILSPDSGRIERIGYMPEERGLYRKMKVRSVVSYFGALKGMGRQDLRREVPRWLEDVGLSEWADKRVEGLSRGMQQKLQFVVTAISNPRLLILDEPFASLDPVNLELLKSIMLRVLDEIRSAYPRNKVELEAEGETDFIAALPMVQGMERKGRKLEVSLSEGADSQEFLRALVDKVRVRSFAEKVPSLHEIFVDLVGADHA
jgi:ABC-2 type transport system ATP-binding protein